MEGLLVLLGAWTLCALVFRSIVRSLLSQADDHRSG